MEILAIESDHRPSKWNVIFNVSHQIQQKKIVNIVLACGVLFNHHLMQSSFISFCCCCCCCYFLNRFRMVFFHTKCCFESIFSPINFRLLTLQTENKKEINGWGKKNTPRDANNNSKHRHLTQSQQFNLYNNVVSDFSVRCWKFKLKIYKNRSQNIRQMFHFFFFTSHKVQSSFWALFFLLSGKRLKIRFSLPPAEFILLLLPKIYFSLQ